MSPREKKTPEQVTLHELLTYSDVRTEMPEPTRRWWLADLVISAVVATGAYVVIRVMGFETPLPVLFAIVLTVLLLRRAMKAVPAAPPPPATRSDLWGVTDDGADRSPPADGVVRAVQRWESRFGWTERDPSRYKSAVQPRLYELVDERLRQRHGITMRSDADRARALIGEQLWTFLHARVARTPNAREMAAVVDEMEKI
ncbi:hypothetical protein [Virgisporangium aurantiacum]|uniref:Uncharacterized protein n=1 Tax=Virgisporangium aurantiacum TaxID=175570 RepID=A0A8J3Z7B1_9ACTN|nr:hypothetical protein [Virgisporangium aurantiacum]GIJ58804.1 hypothetical protein Vau01_063200 [Virgisporangium aurantiacum]